MLCLNHIEDRTFISLYKVHFLDYDLKQVQNKVFYKSDKKTCKCKTAPASSYHHLFPAWLTRTLRSNVFCLLLPAETTACYANRQEATHPPSSLRGGEPSTAVTVSDSLTNACCETPQTEPLLQELIHHFAGKTDLYLPLPVTRLQTTQRFISVTSL